MNKIARIGALGALSALAALALTACGPITIDSLNGQGTCGGNAFTVSTSQNASGDNLSIDYTGPSTASVGLFFSQGFYFNEVVNGETNYLVGDNSDAYAIKLDVTSPGWSTSGSGASTHYAFSGDIQKLLNGAQTAFDIASYHPGVLNATVPVVIGVDCEASHTTGTVTSSWAAAAALYPNELLINALHVNSSTPITNGVSVTFAYPADALPLFGSFSPIAPLSVAISGDDPSISNDSVQKAWTQFLESNQPSATTPVDNHDGTFTVDFTGYNGADLPDGNYLIALFIPNQDESSGRVVFSSVQYSAASGFFLQSLPFQPAMPSAGEPALAETGVNSSAIHSSTAVGVSLLGAGVLAVLLVRRRRQRS